MALSRGSKGFLAVLLVVGLGFVVVLTLLPGAQAPASSGPVTVEIPEGAGAGEIGDILQERGIVRSSLAFSIGTRTDGRAGLIQAGTYQLTPGMDTGEILDQLTSRPPEPDSFRVTIPEGLTVDQTLQRLADAEGSPFTVEQLAAALPGLALPAWVPPAEALPAPQPYPLTRYEGLLFPDTYDFYVDEQPIDVLNTLLQRTSEIMGQVPPAQGLGPYQVLTVGSLIEREARLREEQPIISSVIHNRLADGQALQIDASVLYATARVGENQVTSDQTDVVSPWNTYQTDTLPPTPIAAAGLTALQAAAAPAATDFRYYVVSDPESGAHVFASTLDEHNANVAEYRELQDG